MGEPSATEPWGWQIDGHHLIINYFVLGDQVVMSPVFIGSEPVHATSGKFKGTIVMQDEQDKGLAFIQSLSPDQQKMAIVASVKSGNNALTQAYKDNVDLDYAGIKATELNDEQGEQLLSVIAAATRSNAGGGNLRPKISWQCRHVASSCRASSPKMKNDPGKLKQEKEF